MRCKSKLGTASQRGYLYFVVIQGIIWYIVGLNDTSLSDSSSMYVPEWEEPGL
jgi:hypothetical protein